MEGMDTCRSENSKGRLLIVRHGDRFDYAQPEWRDKVQALGLNPRDPPLSRLGWRQAQQVAEEIIENIVCDWPRVDAILVSPYLRVIQTAQPLAQKLNLPLKIEEGLSETHHCPGSLPTPSERYAYFPTIDTEYESMYKVIADGCSQVGKEYESYPLGYMRRMLRVAETFSEKLQGRNVICFTHAASVSLVSGLLQQEMPVDKSFKFAPCGIFHLEHDHHDDKWKMLSTGFSNAPYITENSPTTGAWGFDELKLQVWNAMVREKRLRPGL